jgi:methylated-DNA-[protein]-cysteine S-methyltransferase
MHVAHFYDRIFTMVASTSVANQQRPRDTMHSSNKTCCKLLHTGSHKLSDFQIKVYTALCQVPLGTVTTYKELAAYVGCNSSRAIGQALKRNPCAPNIPCHRVVNANRKIGGFFGATAGELIQKKIALLNNEGVRLDAEGRIDSKYMFHFQHEA